MTKGFIFAFCVFVGMLADLAVAQDMSTRARINNSGSSPALQTLSYLAAIAETDNPRANPVMSSPPTIIAAHLWGQGTSYRDGEYAINHASLYVATTQGTSGLSAGPTGTGAELLDGSVVWRYVGTLNTATYNDAAEVDGTSYLWSHGTGSRRDVFNYFGGMPSTTNAAGFAQMKSVTVHGVRTDQTSRIEFICDCAKLVIRTFDVGSSYFRVIVDKKFVSLSPTIPPHSGYNYLIVDFGGADNRATRNITVEMSAPTYFGGVDVQDAAEAIYKSKETILKAVVSGDSYTASGGVVNPNDGYHIQFADRLGIRNLVGTAIGGTGLLVPSPSGTAISRASDIIEASPDLIFIAQGRNDGPFPPTQVTEAMLSYLRTFRGGVSTAKTPIFVIGIHAGAHGALWPAGITLERAISQAVRQFDDPLTFFVPSITDPAGSWMTGTGTTGQPNGTGNSDVYVGGIDNEHPNLNGHSYLGTKMAMAVREVLKANGY